MQNQYRYKLERSSRKSVCPQCSQRRFVRYVDSESGQYLPSEYGRCDRESACQYHLNPYSDGYAKAKRQEEQGIRTDWMPIQRPLIRRTPEVPKVVHFDFATFKDTLKPGGYIRNNFLNYLANYAKHPFAPKQLERVVELYYLGTVQHGRYAGAITFPFIDDIGNIRAVQVKQFNDSNHTTAQTFLHSLQAETYKNRGEEIPAWLAAYQEQDTKKISCLFGAHLLRQYPLNPVALVEAPKTAIYGSLYFGPPSNPRNLLWLAVYSKSTFTLDKLKALQGRKVVVFPDLSNDGSTFREWQEKAQQFEMELPGTRFIFSDLLERMATAEQKNDGADLADVIIQHDWREYQEPKSEESEVSECQNKESKNKPEPREMFVPALATMYTSTHEEQPPFDRVPRKWQSWNNEIEELENALAGNSLPSIPLKTKGCSTIREPAKFIQAHLATIKANDGNLAYLPYLERLRDFRLALDEHNGG